ncbi:AAA family ATPase [Halovenus rubra]|uniref:AAA family ATPase n=2 Tax=Halovenus rubra TaxID=869890 RepID=A0ACC7E3U1_9EURY|nr:AAA family ATPase [Halovenus rubra]
MHFFESPPAKDFENIAGMDDLKADLQEKIIEPLDGKQVYAQFGVGVENGILLYGPPGTGKTHIARCLAGELGVNFAPVTTGDVAGPSLGIGVQLIRTLFEEARQNQPALIFFDELDAIATDRSSRSQHHDRKQMVSQLLQELSALDNEEIVIIGGTNDPDAIDDAIIRSGRFDSKIRIPKPGFETRGAIFTYHLPAQCEEIDPDRFKHATQNFSASDLVQAANGASRRAARRFLHTNSSSVTITEEEIFDAIDDVRSNHRQLGEYVSQPPATGFEAVAGMNGLKTRLQEIVIDPLERPQEYERFGISVETGILLYGPPGTGKTHITHCLAGELGINYVECRTSELVSKFVGQGAKNVDQLFQEATQHSPCLVFLDELDALATDRTQTQQTQSQRQMVNQFLQELSELHAADETVIVIGATNRPGDIDTAILRTGRFNEKIEVPPPDGKTRVQILQSHLEAPTGALNLEQIITRTQGFVASDMEQLATESARHALRRSRENDTSAKVTQQDIEAAIRRLESPQTIQSPRQRVVTN